MSALQATQKSEQAANVPPVEATTSSKVRRLIARSRYVAPAVSSFKISGIDQTGQLSMAGNIGA